jgi:hypothetical protein
MTVVQRGVRRDGVAVGGTSNRIGFACGFDAPVVSTKSISAGGPILFLVDLLEHSAMTSRKMDDPSSSSDASTLTRTDSESTASCSESSTVGGCGRESLTFGEDSHPLSVAEESLLQARFAERTAMEMAQIVAYWKGRAAAANDDDLFSEGGQSLPSPEACFPENSLLNTSAEHGEIGFDGDGEIECTVDGDDEDGLQEECASRWIGDGTVRVAPPQESLSRYAPNPPARLRRRGSRGAVPPRIERGGDSDEVCDLQEWTPRMNPSPLVHCQRLATHVAALLLISAIVIRWDENGRLAQAAMRGLLQALILLVRLCLWLLQAALKATS